MSSTDATSFNGPKQTTDGNSATADPKHFDWPLAYEAEDLLRERINAFLAQNRFARRLSERMRKESGTDLFEWVDHLTVPVEEEQALRKGGFVREEGPEFTDDAPALLHPRATLPRVILRTGSPQVLAVRPEHVADFKARHNLTGDIEGTPCSRYRRMVVSEENGTRLEAVERRAYRGFATTPLKPGQLEAILRARELWQTRRRIFPCDAEGFELANRLLDQSIPLAGRDLTCHIFFEAERAHWESRNRAARIQKFRQDQLGLGWGNHDHHTFRCSREHFVDVLEFLLKLGFEKRERYYAGAEAGWGAQILEQPIAGIVVFADADLLPDETQIDFSTRRLPPSDRLGTVGLWVGLHGESLLGAGMHHLEARFDFKLLREQLEEQGVNTMNPFSNFPFLQQAFTEGERWPVDRERAEHLLATKLITREQFEKFLREGALGSHLENLQRRGGYKGFNQKSVSVVIAATDPRKSHFQHGAA